MNLKERKMKKYFLKHLFKNKNNRKVRVNFEPTKNAKN